MHVRSPHSKHVTMTYSIENTLLFIRLSLPNTFLFFQNDDETHDTASKQSRAYRNIGKICTHGSVTIDRTVLIVNQVVGKATGFQAGE